MSREADIHNSAVGGEVNSHGGAPEAVGWETNSQGRLGPRRLDLAPLMSPHLLAEQVRCFLPACHCTQAHVPSTVSKGRLGSLQAGQFSPLQNYHQVESDTCLLTCHSPSTALQPHAPKHSCSLVLCPPRIAWGLLYRCLYTHSAHWACLRTFDGSQSHISCAGSGSEPAADALEGGA